MNELYHYGVKGMKWGVRRYQNPDGTLTAAGRARYGRNSSGERFERVSSSKARSGNFDFHKWRTERTAQKDARRYVNAKQYYGEGAGTRRKLLKGELSSKMKDPDYKKAFDDAVAKEDYGKATSRAIRERRIRDIFNTVAPIAATTAVLAGSLYYAKHKDKVDKAVFGKTEALMTKLKDIKKKIDIKRMNHTINSQIKKNQRVVQQTEEAERRRRQEILDYLNKFGPANRTAG